MKPFLHLQNSLQKPLLVTLWLLLQGIFIQAQTSPVLYLSAPVDSFISVSNYAFLWADTSRVVPFQEANTIFDNKEYLPFENFPWGGKYERGRYAYWMVLNLETDSFFKQQDLILYWLTRDSISFYLFEDNQLVSNYNCGIFIDEPESRHKLIFPTKADLPFRLNAGYRYRLLIRFSNHEGFGVNTPPRLLDSHYIANHLAKSVFPYLIFHGLFFGIIFFLALFILTQYFLHRDKAYLWYTSYLVFAFLFYFRKFGFNTLYHIVPVTLLAPGMYMNLAMPLFITYILFVSYFLDLNKNYPRFHRFNKRLVYSMMGYFLVYKTIQYFDHFLAWRIEFYTVILFGIIAIYFFYNLLKIKNRLVVYVLGGSSVLLIANLTASFMGQKDWSSNSLWDITELSGYVGVLLEVFFFAMGLGYKTRLLSEEKIKFKADLDHNRQEAAHQKELNTLRNTFFTNITHELRTPLTVIISLAEDLKDKLVGSGKHKINLVQQNGQQLLDMINQLLSLSKLEAGKMTLNKKQGNILPFLHYQCSPYQALASNQEKSLLFHSDEEQIIMDFDPDKIQIIVTNLLSNAIKFTDKQGEIVVLVKSITSPTKQLVLQVKDNGRGIAAKEHSRIFDRFYQGEHAENRQGQGTGIGLALVKELVELMDGHIELKSELGKGSDFLVYLPITQKAATLFLNNPTKKEVIEVDSSMPDDSPLNSTGKPSILLVEDNKDVRYVLQLCLQNDYQLTEAEDGEKALELIKTKQPDLIISDIMMPIMDGFELCQHIKDNPDTDNIPLILLTAKATQEDKNKGLACGVDAYLEKPFNRKELLIRVEQLILQRQKQEKKYRLWASKETDSNKGQKHPFLKELNEILEQNYTNENIGISDICRLIGISRSQFYKKLNVINGLSVGQFVKNFRLEKAMGLLLNSPELGIKEIAYQTGFSSPAYFSQVFKETYELSPTSFRKDNN